MPYKSHDFITCQEEEEEEEELEDCPSLACARAAGTWGTALQGEDDTEEEGEVEDEVVWRARSLCVWPFCARRPPTRRSRGAARRRHLWARLALAEAERVGRVRQSLTGELGLGLSPCWGARAVPALVEGGPSPQSLDREGPKGPKQLDLPFREVASSSLPAQRRAARQQHADSGSGFRRLSDAISGSFGGDASAPA